jgi:hypothetical protein
MGGTVRTNSKILVKSLGRWAIRLSLAFGGALIAFLIGEMGIRLFLPKRFIDLPSNLYMPHPILGRVLRPNFGPFEKVTSELSFRIKTNSQGLRDFEIGPKKPNETRILVLGDSFTWGDGVDSDQTYPKQLEELLNRHCEGAEKTRYLVINAGVPEWGLAQMWLYLKEYGVKYQPDAVLLGLFDLDIYRNGLFLAAVFESGAPPSQGAPQPSYLSSLKLWLHLHSRLYNLLAVYLVHSPVLNDLLEKTGLRAEKPREFLSADLGYFERTLKENEKILEMMKDFTHRRGIGFIAVYIPTASQVRAKAEGKTTDDRVAQMMRNAFRDAPESLIDLSSGLARAGDPGTVYYPWDGHWTAKGHRVAAEILWPSVFKLTGGCQDFPASGTGRE